MSELDFPLSELRKLEEGGEYFCSCLGVDTSPLRAPTNGIVPCCLLGLTSPETVSVRIENVQRFLPAIQSVRQTYTRLTLCMHAQVTTYSVPINAIVLHSNSSINGASAEIFVDFITEENKMIWP